MTFSDKIRAAREAAGLTQQQLADKTGVSQRTIASYESAGAIARVSTMKKLAKALDVSYDYLSREEVTDPQYGMRKMPYIDQAQEEFGNSAAREMDELLERNTALFAGGELSEESKDVFFQAIAKAYLECKEAARKTYGRKKKN